MRVRIPQMMAARRPSPKDPETLADIIVHFCTSLHSKFQIRDWLKLTSAYNLTNLRSADINLSQTRI